MGWQIAIDGPAASGKSTVAKGLSEKLHLEYLDTGAMYRAVAYKAINLHINLENEEEYKFLENTTIDFIDGKIYLDGVDISKCIRTIEVSNGASFVSKYKYVREKMVSLQQKLSQSKNIILDGRDIGTVVLPDANLKIFLYANSKVRAERRLSERRLSEKRLSEKRLSEGNISNEKTDSEEYNKLLNDTIEEIEKRDYNDSHREISPLKQADDAIFIDTSELTIEQVIEKITTLALKRGYSMEDLELKNQNEKEETKEKVVAEVKEEVTADEVAVETSEEKVETEALEENVEENSTEELSEEESKEGYKEMQVCTGTVIEVQEAQKEKKIGNKVIKAREERVLIELADGQQGFLFRKDCANIEKDEALFDQFIEGDEVTVAIKKIFPDGGKFIFSTILVEKYNKLKDFEETIKEHPVLVAKVIKKVGDFGLLMKYEDFTCLLPSQLTSTPKEELDSLIGKDLEVVPIRVDLSRIRIIVSQIHAIRKQQKQERKEFLSQLEVGQVYEGVVKNIEAYGAFVELHEGVEGLLHISEFDHNRVSKVEKVLNTGDTVKVQVIKIEKDHIGLSRKALLPNHWADYFAEKQIGDVVTVKAIDVKNAGVRVELTPELEGFVPRSEYSWDREADVEAEVKPGDELACKIIETDKGKRRIILSVKQLSVNPWSVVTVSTSDVLDVKILEVVENGYKVEYQNIKGFMSKGAVKPSETDKVFVDAVIKVKVRAFDAAKQKFIVSMRDAEEKQEKENFNKYKSTDKMTNTFGDYLNDLKKK